MLKYNTKFHKSLDAFRNAKASTNIRLNELDETLVLMSTQLKGIKTTLEAHKIPQCLPDPKCFAILFSAYTIGTWILSGKEGFVMKECSNKLRDYCKCEEYRQNMDMLEGCSSLQRLYHEVCQPLARSSYSCRAERVGILNTFIFRVIIWSQTSHSQQQVTE